jgi:succinyl-diaminopimelate desuccinylase
LIRILISYLFMRYAVRMNDRDRLFMFIDGCRETVIELEREMCVRPAVSPVSGGEGELDKALYIETFLRSNRNISAKQRDHRHRAD